jgi:two-component system nitrate/nitrite response regulator NarL
VAQKTRRRTVKLALLDDHPVVRSGLVASLAAYPSFTIVSQSTTVEEFVRGCRAERPDIVLLGLHPVVATAREIAERAPHVKIIVLASFESDAIVREAVAAGVRGYLLTSAEVGEIVAAIEAVRSGSAYFSPKVSRAFSPDFHDEESTRLSKLTSREREVLALVARGHTSKEIALLLGVSVRTVDTHREHIKSKLEIHSIAGLTRFAVAHHLIEPR